MYIYSNSNDVYLLFMFIFFRIPEILAICIDHLK